MAYLNFVLHAHLPFVRHPEHARFLEEDWLYEAITETYIPLLEEFEALERDGLPFRVTMSLTPPLCEMLADELLQARYAHHINRLRDLAEKEWTLLKLKRAKFDKDEGHGTIVVDRSMPMIRHDPVLLKQE